MKCLSLLWTVAVLMGPGFVRAESSTDAWLGNWKGILDTGPAKLRLVFRITKSPAGDLVAKMDSLDQGVREIPVDSVTAKGDGLRLEVKKVQGVFEGKVDQPGGKLKGLWRQGGRSMGLSLERSEGVGLALPAEQLSPADQAANKRAAQRVAGEWTGRLALSGPGLQVRLRFRESSSGAAVGAMDSPDQGARDIPLRAITLKQDTLRFEAAGIGASYEGTLDSSGGTLRGVWRQGLESVDLEFRRERMVEMNQVK